MDTNQTSPDFLRMSLAAAMSLDLRPGLFYRDARLHCLNLLLTYPGGCRANCSYCGLSRDASSNGAENFIRVEWPCFSMDEILTRTLARADRFERICLSMIMHSSAVEDTIELIGRIHGEVDLPVSVLVNPSTLQDGDLVAFYDAGADMAAVAIDAATENLFVEHRGEGVRGGHKWDRYWNTLEDAALTFGDGNTGVHLIAGLGETEQEMIGAIQRAHLLGSRTHLFSFYPERGSSLGNAVPCSAGHFRRIQLARFLIDCNIAIANQMEFDDLGRLSSFGIRGAKLDAIVESGDPFMTSGCPGRTLSCACNRPFGDGPPSDIRSYPFRLEDDDIQLVRKQLATYMDVSRPLESIIAPG